MSLTLEFIVMCGIVAILVFFFCYMLLFSLFNWKSIKNDKNIIKDISTYSLLLSICSLLMVMSILGVKNSNSTSSLFVICSMCIAPLVINYMFYLMSTLSNSIERKNITNKDLFSKLETFDSMLNQIDNIKVINKKLDILLQEKNKLTYDKPWFEVKIGNLKIRYDKNFKDK